MTTSPRVSDYLRHILAAMEKTDRYTSEMDEVEFLTNELVQHAVVRNIEILGEAANKIRQTDPVFASQNDDVPWQVMYAMRNRVSHGYDKVDFELLWRTIQTDLPRLHSVIRPLLDAGTG